MRLKFLIILLFIPIILIAQVSVIASLKISLKNLDGKEKIAVLHNLATQLTTSDIEQANKYNEEALQLSEKINYKAGIAESWNIAGNISYRQSENLEARNKYKKALQIFEEINNKRGISKVYNNLGLISINSRQFDKAEDYYLKSIELKKELEDHDGISSCYTNLGLMYWQMDKPVTAIDYLKKSLEIQRDIGNEDTMANTYNNLALAHYNINQLDVALEYLFLTLESGKKLNNLILVGSSYNNIGSVYSDMNLYNEAIEYHQKALEEFKKLESKTNIASAYHNLGVAYKNNNLLDESILCLKKALTIFNELNDTRNKILSNRILADVYLEYKQFKIAEEYAKEALKLAREANIKLEIFDSLTMLSDIYLKQDNIKFSEKILLEAKQINESLNDLDKSSNIEKSMAEFYFKKEQFKKAYNHLNKYLTLHDSIINLNNLDNLNELKVKYDLQSKEHENELLKKNIEFVKLQRRLLIFGLIAAILIIALFVFFLVNRVKNNKKLKQVNNALNFAKQEAEKKEKQISLINKMLRHDITNNLSVVISALKLFKKDNDMSLIEEANRKCFAGIELIKNLHSMEQQKIDFAHRHPVQLENLLDKIIKKYPQLNISYQGSANVLADETIESVFTNLIENAVKHGKADKIVISILEVNNVFEIKTYNNGKHIDEKIKNKIFEEKFSYGDATNTGMGLYLVKQNIERYGGSIYVENINPKGVTFVLNLKKA